MMVQFLNNYSFRYKWIPNSLREDSKTANKKKTAFKRKYQESYLNYGFIATGDSYSKPN